MRETSLFNFRFCLHAISAIIFRFRLNNGTRVVGLGTHRARHRWCRGSSERCIVIGRSTVLASRTKAAGSAAAERPGRAAISTRTPRTPRDPPPARVGGTGVRRRPSPSVPRRPARRTASSARPAALPVAPGRSSGASTATPRHVPPQRSLPTHKNSPAAVSNAVPSNSLSATTPSASPHSLISTAAGPGGAAPDSRRLSLTATRPVLVRAHTRCRRGRRARMARPVSER